jgi:hypothetical protein
MGLSFRHDFNLNLVNSICTSTQTVKILFYHYTQGIGHPFSGFSHSFKCRPLNETPGIEKKMPVGYLQGQDICAQVLHIASVEGVRPRLAVSRQNLPALV